MVVGVGVGLLHFLQPRQHLRTELSRSPSVAGEMPSMEDCSVHTLDKRRGWSEGGVNEAVDVHGGDAL